MQKMQPRLIEDTFPGLHIWELQNMYPVLWRLAVFIFTVYIFDNLNYVTWGLFSHMCHFHVWEPSFVRLESYLPKLPYFTLISPATLPFCYFPQKTPVIWMTQSSYEKSLHVHVCQVARSCMTLITSHNWQNIQISKHFLPQSGNIRYNPVALLISAEVEDAGFEQRW